MNVAYRLCSARYPGHSGRGAALQGGRWNRSGVEVIYSSSTVPLAILEILVHYSVVPQDFAITEIGIPDHLSIEHLKHKDLPMGWNSETGCTDAQQLGTQWIKETRTVALSVPSSIVPTAQNIVLNPAHPDFKQIVFVSPRSFAFDPRLKSSV